MVLMTHRKNSHVLCALDDLAKNSAATFKYVNIFCTFDKRNIGISIGTGLGQVSQKGFLILGTVKP